jgi:hypothetical protein
MDFLYRKYPLIEGKLVQNRRLLVKNWFKRGASYDKKPRRYPCFLGHRTPPLFRHISVQNAYNRRVLEKSTRTYLKITKF